MKGARSFHKMSQSGFCILPPHSKPNSEEAPVPRISISSSESDEEHGILLRVTTDHAVLDVDTEQQSPIDAAEENPNHNQTTVGMCSLSLSLYILYAGSYTNKTTHKRVFKRKSNSIMKSFVPCVYSKFLTSEG